MEPVKGTLFKYADGTREYVALTYYVGPLCEPCRATYDQIMTRVERIGFSDGFGSVYSYVYDASKVREACLTYGMQKRAYHWKHGQIPISLVRQG